MTRILFLILVVWNAGWSAQESMAAPSDSTGGRSDYKELYENGYYSEAIALLYEKIRERPESTNIDYRSYLAFCYTASGKSDSAAAVFLTILNSDSTFSLDTITTSPKILAEFNHSRETWRAARQRPSIKTDTTAAVRPVAVAPVNLPPEPPPAIPEMPSLENDWYRYFFYAAPGGTGQFYNQKPARGVIFLALETIGLAGTIWAQNQRDKLWDRETGITDKNAAAAQHYYNMGLAGEGFFIAVYATGVLECIIDNGKTRRAKAH
jgi:hypothetical protein